MNGSLGERRLRELRSRVLVRAWDYRQRRLARGVWFRFRRVLAAANEVYALPPDEARRLVAEGCRPEAVGLELEPPRSCSSSRPSVSRRSRRHAH